MVLEAVEATPPQCHLPEAHPQFLLVNRDNHDDDDDDDDDDDGEELKGYDHTLLERRQKPLDQPEQQSSVVVVSSLLTPAHIILSQQQQEQEPKRPQDSQQNKTRPWFLRLSLPNTQTMKQKSSEWDFLLSNNADDDGDATTLPDLTPASFDDSSYESGSTNSSFDNYSDNCSISSTSSSSSSRSSRKSNVVSFVECVTVHHIPHSSSLSSSQRRRMYSTSDEVRINKSRNKREYRYDGYDWRNVTEEWAMGVDMITGELIHPVHEVDDHHRWRE